MVLATVVVSTPVHADHVAQITSDGSSCVLGPRAGGIQGLGFGLHTEETSIDVDPVTGDLTYHCRFDVPTHVPAAENVWGREWNLPKAATTYMPQCYAPGDMGGVRRSDESRLVVTPSGRGNLTCRFLGQ